MSALPSPLKSPVVMTCQLGPGLAMIGSPVGVVPFISQIAAVPLPGSDAFAVLLYCHRMSACPSPLKSAAVMTCQFGPGLAMIGSAVGVVPFISQIAAVPLPGSD